MSRIVIEIEDNAEGKVNMKVTPKPRQIFEIKRRGGHDYTPAYQYAIVALGAIKQLNDMMDPRVMQTPAADILRASEFDL